MFRSHLKPYLMCSIHYARVLFDTNFKFLQNVEIFIPDSFRKRRDVFNAVTRDLRISSMGFAQISRFGNSLLVFDSCPKKTWIFWENGWKERRRIESCRSPLCSLRWKWPNKTRHPTTLKIFPKTTITPVTKDAIRRPIFSAGPVKDRVLEGIRTIRLRVTPVLYRPGMEAFLSPLIISRI